MDMGECDFKNLFPTFLDAKVALTGGGEISVKEHIEERIEAYNSYRHIFSPTQIQNLRREDFHYFLTPSGNKSWTNLPRACKQAASDMKNFKKVLLHLQKE